ncbi:PIN domain-containing protein [Moraxella bovis]|uniref:PIN domain-containing protein n=1 Tax=Moraxella bovis TaxID=476 RepID=UPI0022264827|nr:PIN domain-containing protein [Moraxella bovis]UYZ69073.1 PIN domain-containing protein [Moraxella bovis]UYZ71447.1 PIN domain-containing protein [Moraxella bovis]UYZ72640.1 PIN domain-containing protein [Moraxella bovis]UZA14741.1 PIN domain-containing protein [Moraxella bovis]UZA26897.1 PIN domain-containing protein [Moraxella bovis]
MKQLILPDNNIFSELTKKQPEINVVQTFERCAKDRNKQLILAITVWHELLYGLHNIKAEEIKKKERISAFLFNNVLSLPMYHYTQECADIHAKICAECRAKGKTLSFADSQIASIALANHAILVTRNVDDFKYIDGLMIENWFDN